MEVKKLVNVNIGVLGHVDSGKTSLCRALSTLASTAAFDSSPESRARGITLDLGFSAFPLDNKWSITLVDCPGHASLIRTVLGGVQIMDIMLLIIDMKKGMQPQAAECLVLANICCPHLIIVLNKVDLIDPNIRAAKIEKATRQLNVTLGKTRFVGQPIISASATDSTIGIEDLKSAILEKLTTIEFKRDKESPFLMAIDHCFNIKGSGTVCTGTILQGKIKIGDTVEFPELQTTKKIKSIQMFKNAVNDAVAGDRVALGVPGLDAKEMERGLVSEPGLIKSGTKVAVIQIYKVPFFKEPIESKKRYHISIGYSTVTAVLTLFGAHHNKSESPVYTDSESEIFELGSDIESFELGKEYEFISEIMPEKNTGLFVTDKGTSNNIFAILEFDKPVYMLPNTLVIGSNLQLQEDILCRLAFHGSVIHSSPDKDFKTQYLPQIKIFWWKTKEGQIDRVVPPDGIIAKGFCTKQSNIDHLLGVRVTILSETDRAQCPMGTIDYRFGQTDKIRISLNGPLTEDQVVRFRKERYKIEMKYKHYQFKEGMEKTRKLAQ